MGKKIKNVLIAMDSFKGSLSSLQAGEAVQRGLLKNKDVCSHVISVADGGEGSLEAIFQMCGGSWEKIMCEDAFHNEISCDYLVMNKSGCKTAYIESAKVIGLHALRPNAKTVENTSSYGLGELLHKIIQSGIKDVVIFLGGTITTDGGLGLLQAIGVNLYDCNNKQIEKNNNPLFTFDHFDKKQLQECIDKLKGVSITIAADVVNTYYGLQGAAHVFAAQKGATPAQIEELDQCLSKVANAITWVDVQKMPSSGAAGGIGGALGALGGKPLSGFDLVNKILEIEKYVKKADLIITGEGSIDSQSEQGKLPYKLAQLAKKHAVPIVALCGRKESDTGVLDAIFNGVFVIQSGPVGIEEALHNTANNLESTTKNIIQILQI